MLLLLLLVCVVTLAPPTCQDLPAEGACPEGTTETMCGGAGQPCCCAPAPAPAYECVAGCGDTPSCDCVTCADSLECQPWSVPYTFSCEALAVP